MGKTKEERVIENPQHSWFAAVEKPISSMKNSKSEDPGGLWTEFIKCGGV